MIPERQDQRDRRAHRPGRPPTFDRAAYRERNVIERAVGWLKERRRVATRYEKLAIQYLAMLYVSLREIPHGALCNHSLGCSRCIMDGTSPSLAPRPDDNG